MFGVRSSEYLELSRLARPASLASLARLSCEINCEEGIHADKEEDEEGQDTDEERF